MKTPERRIVANERLPLEARVEEAEDGWKVVGYAARFYDAADPGTEFELWKGTVERILPGAFARAIREDDVRALFNHESSAVLGRNKASTLRLEEDEKGLRYEIDLGDTTVAEDVRKHLKRGDVTGSSFAFIITDEDVKKEGGKRVREVRGVRLFDVGPVTFPAYPATEAKVRAETRAALEALDEPTAEEVEEQRRRQHEQDMGTVRASVIERE